MSAWIVGLLLLGSGTGPADAALAPDSIPTPVCAPATGFAAAPGPGLAVASATGFAVAPGPGFAVRPSAPPAGAAIGEDKLRHLGMAFAVADFGFGVARLAVPGRDARLAGIGLGLAASLGKEIHDVRAGGPFDMGDLAFDLVGIALAAVLVHQID